MYPLTRLRKLQPDGVIRWSWYGYRLPDRGGFIRLFIPKDTPRLHLSGTYAPSAIGVVAVHPQRPYVVHWWRDDAQTGFYVDTARDVEVGAGTLTYVDLFLDLSFRDGRWEVLDEDELTLASEADAALARSARIELERLIAANDPLFEPEDAMWEIPPQALVLEPRSVTELM